MCSAADSFDIALAADKTDIVASVYDGTPVDPNYKNKINFSKSFAFENYSLYTDPMIYEYSTIDVPPSHKPVTKSAEADYFTLFEFSAKWDPVPTMLTQDHGSSKWVLWTNFLVNRNIFKKTCRGIREVEMMIWLKYIPIWKCWKRGTFTFYGGHDPEDYRHFVGDPPTNLSLHKNSPGYS